MLDTDHSIAVLSTTCLSVPPSGYGGLELIVYHLCHELGHRGYEVTCIAPEGTDIENVEIIETTPQDDSQQCFEREPRAYEMYADRLSAFDLVIDHSWQKHSYRRKHERPDEMENTEIMGVWHGMPAFVQKPVEKPNFLSVSRSAATAWSDHLGYEVRHVTNGIDLSDYPVQEEKGDYLMTLNRITREKGIVECIDLAEYLGVPFKIVGEDKFVDDREYVVEVMRRCGLSPFADYIGQVDHDEKVELLQDALGVVLLPQRPYMEAFGLTAVEAMACGTPVLAMDNAGLGEVVRTVQDRGTYRSLEVLAADAERVVERAGKFPGPSTLREGAEEHFSVAAMTDLYLQRAREAMATGW